jgi:CBS domain-containing protein
MVLMAEKPKYPPITVQPDDTLETVMKTVVENRIHRVYLVDASFKPIGVISLVDIIQALFGKQSE